MDNTIYFEEEAIFCELQSLVYGAVRFLRIRKQDSYFEDYVQDAQLELLRLIRVQQTLTKPDEFDLFKGRSYNKIVWRLRDKRRKLLREEARLVCFDSEKGEKIIDSQAVDPAAFFEQNQRAKEFMTSLTSREKDFVLRRFNNRTSMLELTRIYDCSEKTVYHYRKNIQRKFQENY